MKRVAPLQHARASLFSTERGENSGVPCQIYATGVLREKRATTAKRRTDESSSLPRKARRSLERSKIRVAARKRPRLRLEATKPPSVGTPYKVPITRAF